MVPEELRPPAEGALANVLEMAKEIVGAQKAGIMFYEPDERTLSLQYPAFDASPEMVREYRVSVDGVGAAVRAFRTRQPFISQRCSGDPRVIQRYVEMYRVGNLLTMPLEWESEVIGVWHLTNKASGPWEERDVQCFGVLARRLTGLIEQTRQWQIQERRHRVWVSLMEKMAEIGDVQAVAEVLAHALRCSVQVVDRWGSVRAEAGMAADCLAALGWKPESLYRLAGGGDPVRVQPTRENGLRFPAWVVPLRSSLGLVGFLLVLTASERSLDQALLRQAAVVMAALLGTEERVAAVVERVTSDFLECLAGGRFTEAEAFLRAGRLGLNLRRKWMLVLAVPDRLPPAREELTLMWRRLHVARDVLQADLKHWPQECWVGVMADCSVVVLVAQPDEVSVGVVPIELPRVIQYVLRRHITGTTFSIGVGETACRELSHYVDAFREARRAVDIGRRLNGPGQVTYSGALGANLLLYEAGRSSAARIFSERLLHGLVEYDRKHGGQLVETLEAYLETGANLRAAARRLHTHINTVRYRLARVEEITGRSLKSPRNRFEFQLALQIRRLAD